MDKYEYKVRADEIKALISEGEFAEAVKIADTIDWRRVRSVMMLCTISDLYKINRRYQESKDILLLAYEKHPTGRLIVYSLCELSIKMGEYVQAIEYYKEFVQIAPKDTGRYILQYRLYEAQDVSLEERIAVLEEFKKRDYREKWAYELAYLYHRIGLATKCVEECDEMFLWFGEGKYVIKALELKALHVALNDEQQKKYDQWMREIEGEEFPEESETNGYEEPDAEEEDITSQESLYADEEMQQAQADTKAPAEEKLPEVKTVDVGQYNTINLQMELAASMKEILGEEEAREETAEEETGISDMTEPEPIPEETAAEEAEALEEKAEQETEYRTKAEQKEERPDAVAQAIIAPLLEETTRMPDLKEMDSLMDQPTKQMPTMKPPKTDTDDLQEIRTYLPQESVNEKPIREPDAEEKYDRILSQEYDGQISLVVPDFEKVEKQITGQLSIDDIMAEWEQLKKNNEMKRMEDVRQHILQQTGSLFANFDEATKNGLLEELEKAFMAAIRKEAGKPAIKKVITPDSAVEELEAPEKGAGKPKTVTEEVKKAESEKEELSNPIIPTEDAAEDVLTPEDEVEELVEIEDTVEDRDEAADVEEAIVEDTDEENVEEPADPEDIPEEDARENEEHGEKSVPEAVVSNRDLSDEEKEVFGHFVHHRRTKQQLVNTLDNMSLASCTGNVVLTGEEEDTVLALAKGLIREMQYSDDNFSGKVAKISGSVLNKKDVEETFGRLDNGALIIEKAGALNAQTVAKMGKLLEKDNKGLLLIMADTKQKMNKLLGDNVAINKNFNLRVDIEALKDEALVQYAREYALEQEYSIDEFGILALHTRIADSQTSDHDVTLSEIRDLIDEAIYYANKKTPKHFMDILLAKRYDDEDMIILREKDFMHY